MAYPTVSDVAARAQAFLNDTGSDYWSATTLLPFVNMAYDEIAREFQKNGVGRFRVRATIAVAAGVTTITRATTPALPTDLIEPLELWEKPTGAADTEYVPMTKATDQIPDLPANTRIGYWDWYSDALFFLASSAANTVRVDYIGDNAALTGSSSILGISDCLDAAAFLTAAGAARSRGQREMAQDYEQQGRKRIDDLVNLEVQTMQAAPKRRQPSRYTSRRYYF